MNKFKREKRQREYDKDEEEEDEENVEDEEGCLKVLRTVFDTQVHSVGNHIHQPLYIVQVSTPVAVHCNKHTLLYGTNYTLKTTATV
jgi:predicted HD phosphohydrolase